MDPFELSPSEQQRIMAETLRSQQVLGLAQQRGGRFDNLAAIAPMLNNKGVATAAAGAQERAVAASKPTQLGQQGFMVGGEYAPNPGYTQEKLEGRAQQRGLQGERLLQSAQLQQERLGQQAQQNQANRDMRMQMQSDNNALRRELAENSNAIRREAAAAKAGAADGKPKGKILPASAVNKLSAAQDAADSYADFTSTWQDDFSGPVGSKTLATITNTLGRFAPVDTGYEKQSNWWQNYNAQANKLRNELFGSAQTAAELKLFEEANIVPGMKPAMIRERLGQQAAATKAARQKLASSYQRAGYDASGFVDEPAANTPKRLKWNADKGVLE